MANNLIAQFNISMESMTFDEELKYRTLQRRRTKTVLGKLTIIQVGQSIYIDRVSDDGGPIV